MPQYRASLTRNCTHVAAILQNERTIYSRINRCLCNPHLIKLLLTTDGPVLREIRRRTRVVGAFPDGQSALNLAAARLRHIAGTAWSPKDT